jgi:hypothetical protein
MDDKKSHERVRYFTHPFRMCPGRYAKYYKQRYESDGAYRAKVQARNQSYVTKKMAEDPEGFKMARAEASRRSYARKVETIHDHIMKACNLADISEAGQSHPLSVA